MYKRQAPLLSLVLTAALLFGGWKVLAQPAVEAVDIIRFIEIGEAGISSPSGLGFSSATNQFIVGDSSPACAAGGESACLGLIQLFEETAILLTRNPATSPCRKKPEMLRQRSYTRSSPTLPPGHIGKPE